MGKVKEMTRRVEIFNQQKRMPNSLVRQFIMYYESVTYSKDKKWNVFVHKIALIC